MDRKTLVESAFQKLALGNEDARYASIRNFKKALEFEDNKDIYPDNKIKLYTILVELMDNLKTAKSSFHEFLKDAFFTGKGFHWEGDKIFSEGGFNEIGNIGFENVNKITLKDGASIIKKYDHYRIISRQPPKQLGEFSTKDVSFFTDELPQIWLKSLKYDAFIEQFQQVREQLKLKNEEMKLLEGIFDQIEGKEAPKLLE